MNLDDFSYTENDRRYINPQVSLDEQNAFIDNLRNMQQTDTAQITQDTHNLGTNLPSNLGGLGGGTNYFKSRYQTPQTNSMISDLRATAQANALSTLMNNEISKAKKRYNDAYRAAKKRSGGSGGGSGGGSSLADALSALGIKTTNKNGASGKYQVRSADGRLMSVNAEKLALLKDAANSNLSVWQRAKDEWNKKNGLEKWYDSWHGNEGKKIDDQIEYWKNAIGYLDNAKEM